MEDVRDRVHLVDGSELELLEDCKSIAYTLIDSIEYGHFDRLFSLIEDFGDKESARTLRTLRKSVTDRFIIGKNE